MNASLELELAARPEAVPDARGAVTEFCRGLGIEADVVERVSIAVTEACTNCVRHAFVGECPAATYMLETRFEGEALLVVVHDCGVGMLPGKPSRNAGLGLGLRLIERLADGSDVSSRPGHGTRVAMRFAVRVAV